MKLATLADVRDLVEKHLPEPYRRKPSWRHVAAEIAKAAWASGTYWKFAYRYGWRWRSKASNA